MDKTTAKDVKDAIIAALPKKVELSCVSYDDRLDEDQVEKIIGGDFQSVEESIDEWEHENRHYGIDYVIESINADDIVANFLDDDELEDGGCDFDWFKDKFPAHAEDIQEAIEDRDESNLFKGMLSNTFDMLMTWEAHGDASLSPGLLWLDEDSNREDADRICRYLHIDSKYAQPLWNFHLENAAIGPIGIIWYAGIDDVIDVCLADEFENTDKGSGATVIQWEDKFHVYFGDAYYNGTLEIEGGAKVRCDHGHFGLDTNPDWHKPAFTARYSIVDMMEDYRTDLLAFYAYRSKIIGAAAS